MVYIKMHFTTKVVQWLTCICVFSHYFGVCPNAEASRSFIENKNFSVSDFDTQDYDFWNSPPEGSKRIREFVEEDEEEQQEETPVVLKEETSPQGTGNGNVALLLPSENLGKSFFPRQQQHHHHSFNDSFSSSPKSRDNNGSRRKKHRKSKWLKNRDTEDAATASARENQIKLPSGRNRKKKKHRNYLSVSELGSLPEKKRNRKENNNNLQDGRRKLRNYRKRNKNKIHSVVIDGDKHWEWADVYSPSQINPITLLLQLLNKNTQPGVQSIDDNPLNLTVTRPYGISKALNSLNSTSTTLQMHSTTDLRIPEPPKPTSSRYSIESADDGEREFSRNAEHEIISESRPLEESTSKESQNLSEKSFEDEQVEEENNEQEDEEESVESDEERNVEKMENFEENYPVEQLKRNYVKSDFDAEKRMLGYSITDEDSPFSHLQSDTLESSAKDYNTYMSSSIMASENSKSRSMESSDSYRSDEDIESKILMGEENLSGDLSCLNGTFLPAPSIRHAMIKYVKSSMPGQEYLEADYECIKGYHMANDATRLVCRNRRWLGKVPFCKLRRNNNIPERLCAELGCEHICKIENGQPRCYCYNGFRSFGRKCLDIDECEVNDGRGPCQDKCQNHIGGYECSCDSRPGTVLSPDNHTCQDSNPCSYNNAGCSHTCLSSVGRVFCLCPNGFMLQDDWKTCQDVDECAVPELQTELCRYGCINTPGSYRCAGPDEQQSQSQKQRIPIHRESNECLLGYELNYANKCVDINECSIANGGCTEVCENTDGSFFCACEGDERILSSDRRTCIVAENRFRSIDREATMKYLFRDMSDVSCTPLNPSGRGYLMCSKNETTTTTTTTTTMGTMTDEANNNNNNNGQKTTSDKELNRPGTKCHLKCPHGYELHGEYELTCRTDGTWDGPKHGECVRYSKPRLDCPKDVVAELPPGRDEAFVTYEQPSTDLDWFRYVRSKPSWGTRLEANLKKGLYEITFYARHPVSKKQASCTLKINIEEGQAPKVKGCPSDIEVTGKNGSAITWDEPIFTDNVKIAKITNNENPGRTFSIGGHKIEYEAADEAGWTTKCIFTVVLRPV